MQQLHYAVCCLVLFFDAAGNGVIDFLNCIFTESYT